MTDATLDRASPAGIFLLVALAAQGCLNRDVPLGSDDRDGGTGGAMGSGGNAGSSGSDGVGGSAGGDGSEASGGTGGDAGVAPLCEAPPASAPCGRPDSPCRVLVDEEIARPGSFPSLALDANGEPH